MIIKSLSRRSGAHQLVNYLFKNDQKGKLQPLLKHNLRSKSIRGWAQEFKTNDTYRIHKRKDNVLIRHQILSFSTKDKEHITSDLLKDICRKFVDLRGKENIYLAVPHYDNDHVHLHILQSGTKYLTGESNRLSKKGFHKLKMDMDEFQNEKYPELVNSLPFHGMSINDKLLEKDGLKGYENRFSQKQIILDTIRRVYNNSNSLDHFLNQIKDSGFQLYSRGGNVYGIDDGNRHYRFKTLGYDFEMLKMLDNQSEKELSELEEIRELRESNSNVKEQDSSQDKDEEHPKDDQNELIHEPDEDELEP